MEMMQTQQNPQSGNPTGHMSVMGQEGDTKYHWDAKDPVSVEAAQEVFNAHKAKGFLAFRMNAKGEQVGDGQLAAFDPEAESVLFIPQMQGG